MRMIERDGAFLIEPDTNIEMAALQEMQGGQVVVSRSASVQANCERLSAPTLHMASEAE